MRIVEQWSKQCAQVGGILDVGRLCQTVAGQITVNNETGFVSKQAMGMTIQRQRANLNQQTYVHGGTCSARAQAIEHIVSNTRNAIVGD